MAFLDKNGLQRLWNHILRKLNTKQDTLIGAEGQFVSFDAEGKPIAKEISINNTIPQSDWQENDENNPTYIKNRTHWIENSFTEAVSEMEIENTYIDLMYVDLFELLSPNCNCQIIINGTAYETTAIHNSYNAYEWYIIGNGDLLGEDGGDTNVPFGLFIDRYNENWGECEFEVSTFQMNITQNVVHKIPEIYLPEKIGAPGTGSYSEIFNNIAENTASADYSHAEGLNTTASGYSSHAEGMYTTASGYGSHAEGNGSKATTPYSHAEGWETTASGNGAHSAGVKTVAIGEGQTVVGKYNISNNADLFIVGTGNAETNRKNGFTVGVNGVWSASTIKIGGTGFSGAEAIEVATKDDIQVITIEQLDSICNMTEEN